MKIEVLVDADAVAQRAAEWIAGEANLAVGARGRFVMAVSGGRTPWLMFRALARMDLPWPNLHFMQVDERVAPAGDADRNLTSLIECLAGQSALPRSHIHEMPVEMNSLSQSALCYAGKLVEMAGSPPVLDLVHLGLGEDGHTASLVPGDPVLDEVSADVALTGPYQGRRRVTLTYPVIDRARCIMWVVTGIDKAAMLSRLRDGDQSIPAGRVRQNDVMLFADLAAVNDIR